jgi:hypothetical protein
MDTVVEKFSRPPHPANFSAAKGAGAWKVFSTIPLYARTPLSIVAKQVSENFAVLPS